MTGPGQQKPGLGRACFKRDSGQGSHGNSTASREVRIPANWRDRLPDPASYYAANVAKLSRANGTGWAQGVCPLHDDSNASLSVQVVEARGGWRCFAGCGGGDLVSFHMRCSGKAFKEAVRELVRWQA